MPSDESMNGCNASTPHINKRLVAAQYAVRGELAVKAEAYRTALITAPNSLPFGRIFSCNIGNPQQFGQEPVDFLRQVTALCAYPALIAAWRESACGSVLRSIFAADAVKRAARLSKCTLNEDVRGAACIRAEVAAFIEARDGGWPSDSDAVFLTNGASSAIKTVIKCIVAEGGGNSGIMLPIPQYPLYSASVVLFGGRIVPYALCEGPLHWSLPDDALQTAFDEAAASESSIGRPRALVVINPGNPTGSVLSIANMRKIVEFCAVNGVALLADEVYQENVYCSRPFVSFKRIVSEHRAAHPHARIALFSFHSTSKGLFGECGRRGGYVEVAGDVSSAFFDALLAACACDVPNVAGECALSVLVNPPSACDPSGRAFRAQTHATFASLRRRAALCASRFARIPHMSCAAIDGSLYAFVRVFLSPRAQQAAALCGRPADEFYCVRLLERTGICVIPGSGFGQEPGTFHFRTTILPAEAEIAEVLDLLEGFHASFMQQYPF